MDAHIGDFTRMGPRIDLFKDVTVFTVALPAGKAWRLRILDPKTFEVCHEIELTDKFRRGELYSVEIRLGVLGTIKIGEMAYDFICEDERVIDPYAPVIYGRDDWADFAPDGNRASREFAIYGGVTFNGYTHSNQSPKIDPNEMILYKLHMRGFTKAASGVSPTKKGNYMGLLSKLKYFKELGVNVIELQPFYGFAEVVLDSVQSIDEKGKVTKTIEPTGKLNYWGYGRGQYFAPKSSYFGGAKEAVNNCKHLIKSIHQSGMHVVMELAITADMRAHFITDVLWYWVREYQIDGFHLLGAALPLEEILNHPGLGDTKIFYNSFSEALLNKPSATKRLFICEDSFTCVTRQMQNHMQGSMVQFTNYLRRQNSNYGFVNYAANTTGFTLWDSFCYGEKHNEANGEGNRDGSNLGYTHNYGVEGESNSRKLRQLRMQQVRNALCNVMLAQGVPLLLSGDEVANTQQGNNNPYCQDNELGWVTFGKTKGREQLQAFVKSLINFRKNHPQIRHEEPMRMQDHKHYGMPDLSYHGHEPWLMSVGEEMRYIGLLYGGAYTGPKAENVYIIYNYQYDPAEVALPKLAANQSWQLVMNTGDESTFDFEPRQLEQQQMLVVPGSTVTILVSKSDEVKEQLQKPRSRKGKKNEGVETLQDNHNA